MAQLLNMRNGKSSSSPAFIHFFFPLASPLQYPSEVSALISSFHSFCCRSCKYILSHRFSHYNHNGRHLHYCFFFSLTLLFSIEFVCFPFMYEISSSVTLACICSLYSFSWLVRFAHQAKKTMVEDPSHQPCVIVILAKLVMSRKKTYDLNSACSETCSNDKKHL
jgi:hypothetical protein